MLSEYEVNGYDDSDFVAIVWVEETQQTKHITFGSTRAWTYPNRCNVDATPEVIAKATEYFRKGYEEKLRRISKEQSSSPTYGKRVRVVRGRAVPKGTEGEVFWTREQATCMGLKVEVVRVGIRLDHGTRQFVNAKNVEVINPDQYLMPEYKIKELVQNYVPPSSWRCF